MNTEKLRASIEALREAGKSDKHAPDCNFGRCGHVDCSCGQLVLNIEVDTAARAALAELDAQAARFDRLLAAAKAADNWLYDPTVMEWHNRSGYRTCGTNSFGDITVNLRAAIAEAEKP